MIHFRNVAKAFAGRSVLNGITFDVGDGEIVFVLGRSGTGKSVLLKSVVGLHRPDRGQILVDGRDVTRLDEASLAPIRRECGMVFQNPALFDSLDVFENVSYGVRRHHPDWPEARVRARAERCLGLVHLPGIGKMRPERLSFGMQKRVSLARTIALEPRILLFDEPTTGLDPITTNAIDSLIVNLSRELGTTSVVVSHDMHAALAMADRIVVLDGGEVIAVGSPADLRASAHPLVIDFLAEARDVDAN